MKYFRIPKHRVLALHPTAKGLGYVLIEAAPQMLVDWGIHAPKSGGHAWVRFVRRMIRVGKPTTVVVEDWRFASTLRRTPLRTFTDKLSRVIDDECLPLRYHSRYSVRSTFADQGAQTRHEIATVLVEEFPELVAFLPPKRLAWESLDRREPIFDALALALYEMGRAARRRGAS